MVYFDWNATTPMSVAAKSTYLDAVDRYWANPSTSYRLGAQAKVALEEARERGAVALRAEPESIIFTSGATESCNAILREFARLTESPLKVGISAVEHPAVREAANYYWKDRVIEFPVDTSGKLDLGVFKEFLSEKDFGLVSIMAANNETGVIQPFLQIQELCRKKGIPCHVDATQWVGKMPLRKLEHIDFLSLSAHKFCGPKGVGILKINPTWRGLRFQLGGSQENDYRGGTENVPSILAMVTALEEVIKDFENLSELFHFRDSFIKKLRDEFGDKVTIHGESADRLWNTVLMTLPSFESPRWVSQLDRRGFMVSSGAACSAGKAGPSINLAAMQVSSEQAKRTIRISSGKTTSMDDWNALAQAIIEIYYKLSNEQNDSSVIKIE